MDPSTHGPIVSHGPLQATMGLRGCSKDQRQPKEFMTRLEHEDVLIRSSEKILTSWSETAEVLNARWLIVINFRIFTNIIIYTFSIIQYGIQG